MAGHALPKYTGSRGSPTSGSISTCGPSTPGPAPRSGVFELLGPCCCSPSGRSAFAGTAPSPTTNTLPVSRETVNNTVTRAGATSTKCATRPLGTPHPNARLRHRRHQPTGRSPAVIARRVRAPRARADGADGAVPRQRSAAAGQSVSRARRPTSRGPPHSACRLQPDRPVVGLCSPPTKGIGRHGVPRRQNGSASLRANTRRASLIHTGARQGPSTSAWLRALSRRRPGAPDSTDLLTCPDRNVRLTQSTRPARSGHPPEPTGPALPAEAGPYASRHDNPRR